MKYKIISSNQDKINEYKRFGIQNLDIVSGRDIKEVNGTSEEVAIHKALDAGDGFIIEDAILIIGGVEIVDIKYQLANLTAFIGKQAIFKVTLGIKDESIIKTYTSELIGSIQDLPKAVDNFGFDYCFVPKGSLKSLYELNKLGLKDNFSPRRNAIHKLIQDDFNNSYNVKDIKKWKGNYQDSDSVEVEKFR